MRLSSGFVFTRGSSPYHTLDPRVKLLVSILLFTTALLSKSVYELAAVVTLVCCIAALARVLRRISWTAAYTGIFSGVIFVINILVSRDFGTSILYAVRFVAIVISTSLFFITTSPDELEQVMKTFRLPRDVVFAFVTAVRFIPVMLLDTLQIMDAQKSRGLELEKGNLVKRVKNMIPILVPLVVNSVVRSGELAEAMESRAYGAVPKPTSLVQYQSTLRDKAVAAAAVAFFVAAVYCLYFVLPAQPV